MVPLLLAGCGAASDGSGGASDGSDACAEAFAAAATSAASPSALDSAIRRCRTLDQWNRMADAYPDALRGASGAELLMERCSDPLAALSGYQLCGLLRIALSTPEPTPKPTQKPTPAPTSRPTPRPTAKPQIAAYRTAVCGAVRTLHTNMRTLDWWRDLDSIKSELDWEQAQAGFAFEGATPEEAADRRRIARIRAEAKWRDLRDEYGSDAHDILLDAAMVDNALERTYRYPAGNAARRRLATVSRRVTTHTKALRTWLKSHASTKKLHGIFRDLDATERTLASAVRSLRVDCGA